MKSLVWLRNDIRFDDNPALQKAFINSKIVHVIYIYSPIQNLKHFQSHHKTNLLIESLQELAKRLKKLNVNVSVFKSDGFEHDPEIIEAFFKQHSFDKLFFNNLFGQDEKIRDKKLLDIFIKKSFDYETFDDQTLFSPGHIKTKENKPYSVFTPFKRKWLEYFDFELLNIEFNYESKISSNIEGNIENFDFNLKKIKTSYDWQAGEIAAKKLLNEFLKKKSSNYAKDRNDPILEGTSRISPYLSIGVLSPKRCILEALKENKMEIFSGNKGILKWIDEIVWREFYRNIMFSFPKVSKGQPFQEYSKAIKWRYDEFEYNAWKKGMTGFPIVDAAMRQLLAEGWMHNRLRMVVAMFFTKNMLHDWRLGEGYFMQNLIDGDFSSNNGGWQWSSSTGTDAAPYFRIFNPITQSTNFDKNGKFIKKYIPELRDLDKSVIHNPPKEHRKYCNYPEPILDLKESRLRAIEAFKTAKS